MNTNDVVQRILAARQREQEELYEHQSAVAERNDLRLYLRAHCTDQFALFIHGLHNEVQVANKAVKAARLSERLLFHFGQNLCGMWTLTHERYSFQFEFMPPSAHGKDEALVLVKQRISKNMPLATYDMKRFVLRALRHESGRAVIRWISDNGRQFDANEAAASVFNLFDPGSQSCGTNTFANGQVHHAWC